MKLIVAQNRDGGIGKNGKLLVSIPSDMKYFRKQTTGKTVIMGRSTLESFPGGKPLPKRRNIVLSTKLKNEPEKTGYEVCSSPEELFELVKDEDTDDLFVIGGGQIYTLLLPYCDEALITELDAKLEADTFIPVFSRLPEWEKVREGEPITENGVTYRFTVYRRRSE